ncbi:MAG TPA: CocE/NonD family hydrolase, partial [Caulifigura sp.]|nr:CocE/NonD family hydrolase [Caulifigura sp.]
MASPSRAQESVAGPPVDLIIRGSVEQIHILHAPPRSAVSVDGPNGFKTTATTDPLGGLILRNLPPADRYQVTVAGQQPAHVRVMPRDVHPQPDFYSSQKLDPTRGYITTRDGTKLCYRVVLPDRKLHGPGPYDLIITYSGYQPGLKTTDAHQNIPFEKFSALGYAVAGVNMRGSGCSGGAFDFMEPLTWLDGYDMVEAFAAQPWVDNVALGDQSWPGLTQLYVASTQPPSLDAIVAGSVVGDFYRDVFYPGGIPNIGFGHLWPGGRDAENAWPTRRREVNELVKIDPVAAANQALRGQNINLVETIRKHPEYDDYWTRRSAERLVSRIKVPVLQVVSWQDPQVGGRPATLVEHYAESTPVRLVGVNGFHQYWHGDVFNEITQFLEVYLKKRDPQAIAAYESHDRFVALVESDDRGRTRGRFTLSSLPTKGEGRRFLLRSELAADDADNGGATSTFRYDASKPGSWTSPAQDQSAFTSKPLETQLVLAGPGSADLWISAAAEDVDLQITLSEVRPDGLEMLIQSGWLRASHRALDEPASSPLRPVHPHTREAAQKLVPG